MKVPLPAKPVGPFVVTDLEPAARPSFFRIMAACCEGSPVDIERHASLIAALVFARLTRGQARAVPR